MKRVRTATLTPQLLDYLVLEYLKESKEPTLF